MKLDTQIIFTACFIFNCHDCLTNTTCLQNLNDPRNRADGGYKEGVARTHPGYGTREEWLEGSEGDRNAEVLTTIRTNHGQLKKVLLINQKGFCDIIFSRTFLQLFLFRPQEIQRHIYHDGCVTLEGTVVLSLT